MRAEEISDRVGHDSVCLMQCARVYTPTHFVIYFNVNINLF